MSNPAANGNPEAHEYGATVRRYRDRHGWTRPELAMRLRQVDPDAGWNHGKVNNIERGAVRNPPIRTTRVLSIVLGCTVDELIWPELGNGPDTIQHFAAASDLHLIAA